MGKGRDVPAAQEKLKISLPLGEGVDSPSVKGRCRQRRQRGTALLGALAVDEGNLYNKSKRENLQTLRIMKSCLRHDEIIKLTFYNEIFCFAENEIKSVSFARSRSRLRRFCDNGSS